MKKEKKNKQKEKRQKKEIWKKKERKKKNLSQASWSAPFLFSQAFCLALYRTKFPATIPYSLLSLV